MKISSSSLEAIADYVGVTADSSQYDAAFGAGSTFTGKLSDGSDNPMWTDTVEKAWTEAGGPQIEKAAGYAR